MKGVVEEAYGFSSAFRLFFGNLILSQWFTGIRIIDNLNCCRTNMENRLGKKMHIPVLYKNCYSAGNMIQSLKGNLSTGIGCLLGSSSLSPLSFVTLSTVHVSNHFLFSFITLVSISIVIRVQFIWFFGTMRRPVHNQVSLAKSLFAI